MTQPAERDRSSPGANALSHSPALRRAFYLAALAVAVLPIPVALLHLLPAYRIHNLFLVFYAPLLCLITLGYLFYVRDSLARVMFRHLLSPVPRDYYPEPTSIRLRHMWAKARNGFLALLPGVLLLTSFVCVMRYMSRLNESVAAASAASAGRLVGPEDVGLLSDSGAEREVEPTRVPAGTRRPSSETRESSRRADTTAVETAGPLADRAVLRQRALQDAATADIPYFAELTMLYIGSFLAALMAFALMGLREYAKEALGLSERDVVLGGIVVESE
jgi:hypothetical protein